MKGLRRLLFGMVLVQIAGISSVFQLPFTGIMIAVLLILGFYYAYTGAFETED